MFSPVQIANKFIELGVAMGSPITPMQAQKLTYIAHGISLGHRDMALLNEPVCAWRYGPVVPSLYHCLKHNGSAVVTNKVADFSPITQPQDIELYANQVVKLVFDTYARYSGEDLSTFTHREGTPWSKTYHAGKTIIDDHMIADYYKRLMAKDPTCIGL